MSKYHQLAAIMFADIAGYTALMQEDERSAIHQREKFKKKLTHETLLHQGRVMELRGDGALCSFSSTIEAARAALAIQLDMRAIPAVPVRIGIHTGDVMIEGNTIYGDGVNIASRMESFAVPGSIFISGKVFDDIKNQKDIQCQSMGTFTLKNVLQPIEIYAISNAGIITPDPQTLQGKGEKLQPDCVLVLPFVNMSTDTEQEYFSDGLTEELISSLSRLTEIKVISRTTSMKYKGTSKDTKSIAMETGANYIMEGSVRKQGSQVRISAKFIDAKRDLHTWSDNYRGTMDDIFDIQERVARRIAEALRLQLTKSEQTSLEKRYTENSEAYQLYLQGRFFWNKRNEQGLRAAIRHFEKALEKDSGYALAWAGIADSYSLMGEYTNLSRRTFLDQQTFAVNKALTIDKHLGEARISLGISLMLNEWDWKNAEREFKKGIELSPRYATGHHWYAELLMFSDRMDEAAREIGIAVDLDPVSQGILKDQGLYYYYNRQYEKAIRIGRDALELDPGFSAVYRMLSMAYLAQGMIEEAIQENEKWRMLTGNDIKAAIGLAHIYATAGKKDEANSILSETDITTIGSNDFRGMALVYAALNEKEKAFDWLEKSLRRHEESLCSLKIDPKFDNLRNDPQFVTILQKIGLIDNKPVASSGT